MDCGSSLNDSFELKFIERQLHSAISSRTISIHRLFDHHHPPPLLPPQQLPQPIFKKILKIFLVVSQISSIHFQPQQAKTGSQDPFFAVFDGGSGGRISLEFKSMAAAMVIGKSAFERFTPPL
ncbi:hypothetical protein CsSME_00009408 [Camellia sinensis var. sinensis]